MILSRLYLHNFRQYEEQVIEFSPGITGIVGPNGAGKSTILEGISWCLYGNRAARSGKEGIKRQMAADTDDCQVRLDFVLDGREYGLTRTIKGKSGRSEATLMRAGKIDAVSTREVDNFIIKLLGLDLKGFSSSFFARQKELNALSDARPAQRKDHLAQMLGVGRLDTALGDLRNDIRGIRQKLEILMQNLIEEDLVKSQQRAKEVQLKQLKQSKSDISEKLKSVGVSREDSNRLIADLSQRQIEYQKLDKELAGLQSRLEQIQTEANKRAVELNEISDLAEEKGQLEKRIADFSEVEKRLIEIRRGESQRRERDNLLVEKGVVTPSLDGRLADHEKYLSEVSLLNKRLASKADLLQSLESSRQKDDKLRAEFRAVASDLKVLESDRKKLESQKGEIGRLGPDATCKFCLRPLGEHLGDIERHFEQELTEIGKGIVLQRKRLSELEVTGRKEKMVLSDLENSLRDLVEDEKALSVVEVRLAEGDRIIEENRARLKGIDLRLSEIGVIEFDADRLTQAEQQFASRIKDRERLIRITEKMARQHLLIEEQEELRTEQESVSVALKQTREQVSKIGFDLDRLVNLRHEAEQYQAKESHLLIVAERNDGQIRLVESEREFLRRQLADFIASKKEISKVRVELTVLERLSVLFAEFRVFLIGRIRPTLSRGTSDLFREMTDGLYQEIELDEEYNLKILDRGESHPINRFSGGEIDLANLCFRLAISIEMAAMAKIANNFVILDEVFGSQDLDRRQMIIEGLARLTNRFPQIIIVSHIEGIKDLVENRIIIERDQFGQSRALVQIR